MDNCRYIGTEDHRLCLGSVNSQLNCWKVFSATWSNIQKLCLFKEAEFYCLCLPSKFSAPFKLLFQNPLAPSKLDQWFDAYKYELWRYFSGFFKVGASSSETENIHTKLNVKSISSLRSKGDMSRLGRRIEREWGFTITEDDYRKSSGLQGGVELLQKLIQNSNFERLVEWFSE